MGKVTRCAAARLRADWKRLGPEATVALNGEMLETGQPDLVLACPGGPVTADLVARAEAAGIRVERLGMETP